MIDSAVAVQTKGFRVGVVDGEVVLDRGYERWHAGEHAATDGLVGEIPDHRSITRFSHELDVGVECRWKRGSLANHAFTLGWVWIP
jgi:hypothetical protein